MSQIIKLNNGLVSVVDDEDYEDLTRYRWGTSTNGTQVYAKRREHRRTVWMHRFIINAPSGCQVDHKNRNGLDNRKENLRLCSVSENQANRRINTNNTSGYKGVCWYNSKNKWISYIRVKGKRIWLGSFVSPEDAALVYDVAAARYFGQFARLNFDSDST